MSLQALLNPSSYTLIHRDISSSYDDQQPLFLTEGDITESRNQCLGARNAPSHQNAFKNVLV